MLFVYKIVLTLRQTAGITGQDRSVPDLQLRNSLSAEQNLFDVALSGKLLVIYIEIHNVTRIFFVRQVKEKMVVQCYGTLAMYLPQRTPV
jgi:hypothetical protein